MKRYQNVLLFLLVLAVIAQVVHVMARPEQTTGGVAQERGVRVGDTVGALTGQDADGALAILPLHGTVTVLYAFDSECGFCDDVAPEWASHFATPAAASAAIRRIAVTRDLPGPAATYAERFGWQVDLLSVAQPAQAGRESSLVSKTPWVFVFDSNGVLRFQDHGAELQRMEEAIAAIQTPQMSGGAG